MSTPLVSVLMGVRNGLPYLPAALESILAQSFEDFELIVIDDGSTDGTWEVLEGMARRDARVVIKHQETNRGLTPTLNATIELARGAYLARMDADDLAERDRLGVQFELLEREQGLVLAGSNVMRIDEEGGTVAVTDLPLEDSAIRAWCMFVNPIVHPSVMMRAAPFREQGLRYDESFETTQDWELWTRLLACGRARNVRRPLVSQRQHDGSVSRTRRRLQRSNSRRVQVRYAKAVLGNAAPDREDFELMARGLLGDRHEAETLGIDRVAASRRALDLYEALARAWKELRLDAFERQLVWRVVRVGLTPPIRRGWTALALRLALRHPSAVMATLPRLSRRALRTDVPSASPT